MPLLISCKKTDGLKVDRAGNLFATGPGGVLIFSPEPREILAAAGLCGLLCGTVYWLKRRTTAVIL